MAVQANGITVLSVEHEGCGVRFLVGSVRLTLFYNRSTDRFVERGRGYDDGRRNAPFPRIPDHQYLALMRQAHAIARDRGWKK